MSDKINHPDHYQTEAGIEAIEVIEAFFPVNFHFANAFKYLARAGKKDDFLDDLDKAIWYLERFRDHCVRFTITEKDRAILTLRNAGYDAPYAKRVAYRTLAGLLFELQDNGLWGDESFTTDEIILLLKDRIDPDNALVALDEDGDVIG